MFPGRLGRSQAVILPGGTSLKDSLAGALLVEAPIFAERFAGLVCFPPESREARKAIFGENVFDS